MLKKDKAMIHFSGRRHTKLGILSAVIGIAVVAGFISISIVSAVHRGNGGLLLGVVGMMLFALSVAGFVLSYKAFKQKDIFYRFPVIGIALNGFMTVFFIIIYIMGVVS